MGKDLGIKMVGAGTERMELSDITSKQALIHPSTRKGARDKVKAIIILDWDGELYTVAIDAPINMKQALTGTYWAELSAKANKIFRQGLAHKVRKG